MMTTGNVSLTSPADSETGAHAPADNLPIDILVIQLAYKRFGVCFSNFKEIIQLKTITPVQDAPYFLEGIIHHNGKTRFVIDMRTKLGLSPPPDSMYTSIMLVSMLGVEIGFIVDTTSGVIRINRDKIAPIPKIANNPNYGYIIGSTKYNNKSLIVIDVNRLLSASDRQALSSMYVSKKALQKSIDIAQGL